MNLQEEKERPSFLQNESYGSNFIDPSYCSYLTESTQGNTLRRLVDELKHTNTQKQQEYEALLNYITMKPSQKEVYFVRDYLDKDLVMKAHFDENGYDNQKKLMERLQQLKKMPGLAHYRENIIKIKELTLVRSSPETENKILGYISIEQDVGQDYFQYLQKLQKPLVAQEIFSYIYQIVRGLSTLNLLGLVHGDVKSNNLIIVNQKKPLGMRFIKVIDFGASKKIETTKTLSLSMNVGTLRYQPLEKYQLKTTGKPIEFKLKVDSWSLGIVILETLLAGHENTLLNFVQICPQHQVNFGIEFFKNFISKSFTMLQELRGEQVELQPIFQLAKFLLEINPSKRIDIYSALKYLKQCFNQDLNSMQAIKEFRETELDLCKERRQGTKKIIREHEYKYQYVTLACNFDRDLRLDTLTRQNPVKKYAFNLVPTIVLPNDTLTIFDLDSKKFFNSHDIKGDVRQAQSIYLHLGKGMMGVIGGYERAKINVYSKNHYYIDPLNNEKVEKTDLIEGRAFAATTTYSVNLSITVGGLSGEGVKIKSQTLIYAWNQNTWKVGPFLVNERMHAAVCRCGEYIYAVGGQWSNFNLDQPQGFFIWDLPIERWHYGAKREKFQTLQLAPQIQRQFYRKNASIAPVSDKQIILFGGFRSNEENKDGLILLNTDTLNIEEFQDPKKDLYFYFEAMWVPLQKGSFCVAKAFDYEVDLTEFAIFNLEEEEGKNRVNVQVYREPKPDPAPEPAPVDPNQ